MTRVVVDDGVGYEVRMLGLGPPLLLIHGFTGSGRSWDPLLADLGAGRRTVTVDLLGHGGSDVPPTARHAVDRQAADLVAILDRLGADPADVLGYSLGARIALRLAIDSPAAVRHLILESPAAGIAHPDARAVRRTADQGWVEELERGDLAGFVRDWGAQPIFASQAQLPAVIRDDLAVVRLANRPDGLAASLRGAGQGVMTPLHELLDSITAPTLVISGRHDPRGAERAVEVAAAIPGAIHQIIEEAGHSPHLETPARFCGLVTGFLATPDAATVSTSVT